MNECDKAFVALWWFDRWNAHWTPQRLESLFFTFEVSNLKQNIQIENLLTKQIMVFKVCSDSKVFWVFSLTFNFLL